jgi:hypothetical protein
MRQGCPLFTIFFYIALEFLVTTVRQEELKGLQIAKGKSNYSYLQMT